MERDSITREITRQESANDDIEKLKKKPSDIELLRKVKQKPPIIKKRRP